MRRHPCAWLACFPPTGATGSPTGPAQPFSSAHAARRSLPRSNNVALNGVKLLKTQLRS